MMAAFDKSYSTSSSHTSRVGVFLVHGLFGHPDEYRELRTALETLGLRTAAPSLLSHGDRRDLLIKDMTVEEALETLRADFKTFAQDCDEVLLVGHSMGGLLSAMLAAEKATPHGVDALKGLVLISAPYNRGYWVNAQWDLLQLDVGDFFPALRYLPEGRTGLPRPAFKPWWQGRLKEEAEALFALAELRLPEINVPTWLLHSPQDLVVPYGDMLKLANAIDKPELISMRPLERCGHQVFPTSRAQLQAVQEILTAIRTTTSHVLQAVPEGSTPRDELAYQVAFDSVGADAMSVIAASQKRQ